MTIDNACEGSIRPNFVLLNYGKVSLESLESQRTEKSFCFLHSPLGLISLFLKQPIWFNLFMQPLWFPFAFLESTEDVAECGHFRWLLKTISFFTVPLIF